MRLAPLFWLVSSAAASAQSHTVVALSHSDHTVNELDPVSGKILHKFTAVDQPHEGIASPDGKTFYAAVPNGPHVVILETAGFTETGRIESPFFKSSRANGSASPHGIALTGDGSKLYVGLENADVPGIVVYDTRTNKVLRKIDVVLRGGHFLAIQPGTDKLYYPMRDDNRVLVIDTKTDAITKIITVNGGPVGVGFAPNGEVWIHCDGDGSVAVIDGKRDSVVATLKNLGQGPGRMAVSRDGKWAASTHGTSQDVALINAATRATAATIKLGRGPGFPVFSPDGSKLYVMNVGEGDVAVIDTKSMAVVARHKVGSDPFGGGILIRRDASPDVSTGLARLRAATKPFHSIDSAAAAGYARTIADCLVHEHHGAMGYHHSNPKLADATVDIEHPEILLYERMPSGEYRLNGVEFIVPYRAWPRDTVAPTLMGQRLKHEDNLKIWYLHVWAWSDNTDGVFADFNPSVQCPESSRKVFTPFERSGI